MGRCRQGKVAVGLSLALVAMGLLGTACNDGSSAASADSSGTNTNSVPDPVVETNTNAVAKRVIVAMGDSITTGEELSGPSYTELLTRWIGVEVYNEGVGGHRAGNGAALVDDLVRLYSPGYVLIMYGVIDQWHSDRSQELIDGLDFIVTFLREHDAVPVVATIPPSFKDDPYLVELHEIANRRIRSFARAMDVYLVDVGAAMEGRPDLFLDDGLHPNNEGTALMADLFYDALVDIGAVQP